MSAVILGSLVESLGLDRLPDMKVLYAFFASLLGVFAMLVAFRWLGRLRERQRERRSAWQSFQRIAKARGLKGDQIRALAVVAREAKLRRPAQLMGSIHIFDRSVGRALDRGVLTESQQLLLESVRKRLLSTVELRDGKREKRQLERVACALRVGFVHISRGELEQELGGVPETSEDTLLKEKLSSLAKDLEPISGQVINLSAGGVALMVGDTLEVDESDYLSLSGDASVLPVDFNGIYGQIRTVERMPDKGISILHVCFLPYAVEQKRKIIQLVYQQQEEAQKRTAKRPPAEGGRDRLALARQDSDGEEQ